jgi:hypothetical protein
MIEKKLVQFGEIAGSASKLGPRSLYMLSVVTPRARLAMSLSAVYYRRQATRSGSKRFTYTKMAR